MSLGYGVGDCIAVGHLAWKVYKSCRDAPESFGNIAMEVLSLHAVLKTVEESGASQDISESRQANLAAISSGCQSVLIDLQAVVDKYESLGAKSKRTFDRMGWGSNDLAELRARLTTNLVMLNTFMSTSQFVVEKKLDKLIKDFQNGKLEGSILSVATVESLSLDEKQMWRAIRKELDDIGITVAAFDANKGYIMEWFRSAISQGAFDEYFVDVGAELVVVDELNDTPRFRPSNFVIEEARFDDPLSSKNRNSHLPVSRLPRNELSSISKSHVSVRAEGTSKTLSPPHTVKPVAQIAPSLREKRTPRVVSLVAWALRYDAAFIRACGVSDLKAAEMLLAKGANVESRKRGETALSWAFDRGDDIVVEWLLQHGAYQNELLFHLSVYSGRVTTALLLLRHGARIESRMGRNTPLVTASRRGWKDMVEMLLAEGASVNAMEFEGFTALDSAVEGGHLPIVEILLAHGTNINTKDKDGDVALLCALRKGFDEIACLLIEHGADVYLKDAISETLQWSSVDAGFPFTPLRANCTALHTAVVGACSRSIDLLLKKDIDVNATDSKGYTPLDYAVALNGRIYLTT